MVPPGVSFESGTSAGSTARGRVTTHAAILRAAVQLFAEVGYEGASIRELATRAGCSPANVYHHHRNKYELFVTIIESSIMLHMASLRAALAAHESPLDQLRAVIMDHLRMHLERVEFSILRSDFHPLKGEERRRFIEERDQYERGVRAIVFRAKEMGLIDVEDPKLAVMMMLDGCNRVHRWYRSDGPLSSTEVARRITDFYLAGFGIRS